MILGVFIKTIHQRKLFNYNLSVFKTLKFTLFTNNSRGLSTYNYLKKRGININKIVISKKNLDKKIFNELKRRKLKVNIVKNLQEKNVFEILKKTDLALVCGFPLIFRKKHLKFTKYGFLNQHAGTLPMYRGGSPLNWQIINGEKYFGISVIKINEKIDEGDIVVEKKFKLLKKYKIEHLQKIANKNFGKLTLRAISKLINNVKLKKQTKSNAKYFKQRNIKDSCFIPNKTSYKNLILLDRAVSKSYPRPYFKIKSKKIIINNFKKITKKIKMKKNYSKKFNKKYLKLSDTIIEFR